MSQIKEKLFSAIEELQHNSILLLKKLVQEKSVQGNESNAQAIIIEKLRQLKLETDIYEPSKKEMTYHPYFVTNRESFKGSTNVVALRKGRGGGKSIILNGHIDVVPEGDATKWKFDPYSGVIENGKLYGRGSTDMKGGNVALLLALEAIVKCDLPIKGDILFQSVIDEECGGAGSLSTILRGYKADGVLIPEPTNMKLFIKQQGSMWFRVTVKGKSAHGGTRYEGVSAIDKAFIVYQKLLDIERIRNQCIIDPYYKHNPIPFPINVGMIQAGNWPSSVPDLATIEGRIGVGPHETLEDVKKQLEEYLLVLGNEDEWFFNHPVSVTWFGAHWLPNEVKEAHPFAQTLKESYEVLFDKEVEIGASPWGTDAGMFGTILDVPALVIGPGETKIAHDHNEYIVIDEVINAAKLFALFIINWCELDEGGIESESFI